MLALSLRLWVGSDLPRVPFVRGLPTWPLLLDGLATALLLIAAAGTVVARRWRPWCAVSLVVLAWLVLNDQQRFQAWAYQYAMIGFFLTLLPGGRGLSYARGWYVALYLHSALSKLDVSFRDELGPVFLQTALAPLGLNPWEWPTPTRGLAALSMPCGELAVAAALAWPASRRWGRAGAVLFHGLLIGILGPFGLKHSVIVLLWNAALASEVWITFGPVQASHEVSAVSRPVLILVGLVFWAGVLLPLTERSGWFDPWPSHALYASHVERANIFVHESELASWPDALARHVRDVDGDPWQRVDLTAWSREARGTPAYPGNRATLGLAEGLAARYGTRLLKVVALGPADRWTGARHRVEATGLKAIRALGDAYLLNAHAPHRSAAPDAARE